MHRDWGIDNMRCRNLLFLDKLRSAIIYKPLYITFIVYFMVALIFFFIEFLLHAGLVISSLISYLGLSLMLAVPVFIPTYINLRILKLKKNVYMKILVGISFVILYLEIIIFKVFSNLNVYPVLGSEVTKHPIIEAIPVSPFTIYFYYLLIYFSILVAVTYVVHKILGGKHE